MTREQEFRKQTEEAKFEAFSVMCEKVNELEKENAELKKQQFTLRNERNTFLAQNEQYEKDLIDFNVQLSKAKEIINNCVHELQNILLHKIRNKERIASILDKTEQFLKEVV